MAEHRTPNPGVAGSSPAWPVRRREHTHLALQEQISKARDIIPRAATFLQEVWAELKKVHWPSRKETYAATAVVLVVVGVVAIFLGVVDLALSSIIQAILR